MMPNANNLALSLVSEKGKNPVKGNKSNNDANSDFLKIFDKNKKEDKKKNHIPTEGVAPLPFKFGEITLNGKEALKTNKLEKVSLEKESSKLNGKQGELTIKQGTPLVKANNLEKVDAKNEVLKKDIQPSDKVVSNAITAPVAEVLGKRIESTKSTNLKSDKGIEVTSSIKGEQLVKSLGDTKVVSNLQSLKKENLKVEDLTQTKAINNLEVKNPNFDVQNKGRITPVFTKGNPLNGVEEKAKTSDNFAQSDIKRLEPNQPTISSYGLKKINDQIRLEDKLESVKDLKSVQKDVMNDKLGEKAEILPMMQVSKNYQATDKVELPNNSPVSSHADYNAVMQQVENGIKINYNNQLKEMKIKLQPEELGEVEVKMTIENNIMKAQFVVESQTVKEILESRFDSLRNALENKGFNGAEINVSVSTGDNKRSQNNFVFNNEKRENRGTVESKNYGNQINHLESNSKINKVSNSSGIDIMI